MLLIDENGVIVLVEVKKEGNADVRRVAAQLLDYAAAIWGKDVDEFEREILSQRAAGPANLREFLTAAFPSDDEPSVPSESGEDIDAVDARMRALANGLEHGAFVLVVAAPHIEKKVARVLRYLNAQGLRVYGVEYSYFRQDDVGVLVPRVEVGPESVRRPPVPMIEVVPWEEFRPEFIESVDPKARDFVQRLMDGCEAAGGTPLTNLRIGPKIRLSRDGASRTLVEFQPRLNPHLLWVVTSPKGLPPEPFEELVRALPDIVPGFSKARAIRFLDLDASQLDRLREALVLVCERVLGER